MAKKTFNMEMGNLICKFGNEKVLLDFADEIVIPSFTDTTMVRSYNKTSYFFHDVSLIKFKDSNNSEEFLGVTGRYIKDTTLEREQIFQEGNLVHDHESIRSSPSAIFLLILNHHRLIYVRETKDAPSKGSFKSTLLTFLRKKHKEHIDKEFNRLKGIYEQDPEAEKVTKTQLFADIPRPSLDLIALTSEDDIGEFVRKYSTLKDFEISFADRNDEVDNDPFFEEFQKRQEKLGSKKSIVKHRNSKGLDKEKVISEIAEATEQGNQSVKLSGEDNNGDILRGNNDSFQLRVPLEALNSSPKKASTQLFQSFNALVSRGLVKIPETSDRAKAKVGELLSKVFNG